MTHHDYRESAAHSQGPYHMYLRPALAAPCRVLRGNGVFDTARDRAGAGIRRTRATDPRCAQDAVGLAAWILDHDARSYALIARVFDGKAERLTRDDVLDNITLYWLTKTGVSSARLYWENKLPFFVPLGIAIPVAVSAFPDEFYQAPRSWAERAYPKLIHYNKLDKGGHFAAWEQPQLFSQEIRAAFRSLRQSRSSAAR